MKNVVFGVLATLFIAGCGTVGRIDAERDSMTEFPGESDMYLVERKVRNLKFNAAYVGEMLSRVGSDNCVEQIDRISGDSRLLRQIVDRLSLEMQELVFELEEQDRLRIKEKDDRILARMRSLIIPQLNLCPRQTLHDVVDLFLETARHPSQGDAIEIDFNLYDAAVGWADDRKAKDSPEKIEYEEEGELVELDGRVYKRIPIIKAIDISLYEALKLVCESVGCCWDLRDGTVYISLASPTEFSMCCEDYPAPLSTPDRDWVSWLSAKGIHMPQGSTIIYDRHASKLRVTTSYKGIEIFENAIPVIYAGNEADADVR